MEESVIITHLQPLLKKYQMKVDLKVLEKLASYVHIMIVNICSALATLAIVHNPKQKKVTPKVIKLTLEYVKKQCYPELKGGSYVIDSEYFGKNSSAYTEGATDKAMAETIDFTANTARSEISQTMSGGCGCAGTVMAGGAVYAISEFTEVVLEEVRKDQFLGVDLIPIFAAYDTTISDSALEIVKQVLKMHLNCFMYDLKKLGKLTIKKVEGIANKRAHSVFV